MGNSTAGEMNELVSLAAEINKEHNLAEQMAKTAIEHALKAGELLIQTKSQCSHGEWLPWLDGNLEIGARQAQKYMRLATHREGLANASRNSHLTIDTALAALAAPGEQADKSPSEMLMQAMAVVDQLTPPRLFLSQPDLVDIILKEMDPPYPVMLKIMAAGAKGNDGVIWRTFNKRMAMLGAARECASYYAGLTIRDIADTRRLSISDVITGICEYSKCTADTLRKCLSICELSDSPPVLPNPDDLQDYVRQQVAIEIAA